MYAGALWECKEESYIYFGNSLSQKVKLRTILISGASRGIGRSIALKALEDGHRISIGARDLKAFKGTELDPNVAGASRVLLNYYEAKSHDSARVWINSTLEHFGSFDSLINSAGIFRRTSFLFSNGEEKDIEDLWKINFLAPWTLSKEAWSEISKNGEGRIIFLVSMSGKRSKGDLAGYTVSKFGLMGLCQTIRNEGWDKGIRVTTICPSWVNTEMASNIKSIKKEDMTQPKDIAFIVSNLLKLPDSCIPYDIPINCNLEN